MMYPACAAALVASLGLDNSHLPYLQQAIAPIVSDHSRDVVGLTHAPDSDSQPWDHGHGIAGSVCVRCFIAPERTRSHVKRQPRSQLLEPAVVEALAQALEMRQRGGIGAGRADRQGDATLGAEQDAKGLGEREGGNKKENKNKV